MVQELPSLESRLAALDRRVKDLERIQMLGLAGGGDIEATLQRHTALLGILIGDQTLGNVLLGPFPGSLSSMSVRRADSEVYIAGTLNGTITTTTEPLIGNILRVMPIYVPEFPNIIDSLTMEVTAAGVGGTKARLGIYQDGVNLYPGKLLLDAGTINVDSIGFKTITMRQELPRGLSWVGVLSDSGAVQFRSIASGSASGGWAILGHLNTNYSTEYLQWFVARAFGVLPDQFPAGGAKGASNTPIIAYTFATS
ncbi:hypothetical protein LCGC14_0876380 [marine sediment metagenome]|uniref:Uncharacterized protein n=1 Tax=marine sediment metagenome TaxID=412755 RepID=A0A0F9SA85_9ZZZZ